MTRNEAMAVLAQLVGHPTDPGRWSSADDAGIDSVTMLTIVVRAEDRFGMLISDEAASQFRNLGDLADYLVRVLP